SRRCRRSSCRAWLATASGCTSASCGCREGCRRRGRRAPPPRRRASWWHTTGTWRCSCRGWRTPSDRLGVTGPPPAPPPAMSARLGGGLGG
ncbi:unnamed protein product, partial [Prorocentrum cordatum]